MKIFSRAMVGVSCVLGVGLVASAAALQQEDGLLPQRAAGLLVRHMERRLNLTGDQRERIKAILKSEQPAIQLLAARVHAEREQMESQPYDEVAMRSFVQHHETTMEDVVVEREKVRAEIQAVLTPEQRKMSAEMRESLYARFVERLSTLGDQL
jgi:periplasmic protein CpxP/Spy